MNKLAISKETYQVVSDRDCGCVLCPSQYWLQCHHIIPKSAQGLGIKENLVMLCKTHHDTVHSDMKRYIPILLAMNEQHYGKLDIKDLKLGNKWAKLGGM